MSAPRLRHANGDKMQLRWSQIDGAELRCPWCGDWWALDPEFWTMNSWDMCKVCARERSRLWQAMRRLDPDFREREIRKTRRYRAQIRRLYPGVLQAYDRERKALYRSRLRAYTASKREAA